MKSLTMQEYISLYKIIEIKMPPAGGDSENKIRRITIKYAKLNLTKAC